MAPLQLAGMFRLAMAVFRQMLDAELHERVAREHVERGMSVVELHRNHGVPLAAVRKWIALFQSGGREAVQAAARELARVQRKPPTKAALAKVRAALTNSANDARSHQARVDAVITIGVRRIEVLAAEVESLVTHRGLMIEALLTLGDLGELERIDRVAARLDEANRGWVESS